MNERATSVLTQSMRRIVTLYCAVSIVQDFIAGECTR